MSGGFFTYMPGTSASQSWRLGVTGTVDGCADIQLFHVSWLPPSMAALLSGRGSKREGSL